MTPSPHIDAGADAFCRAWMSHRRDSLLRFTYIIAASANALSLVLLPLFVAPATLPGLLGLHSLMLLLTGVGALNHRRPRFYRGAMVAIGVLMLAGYELELAYAAAVMHSPRDILLASAGVIAYMAFAIQLFPLSGVPLAALVGFTVVGSYFAAADAPGGGIWTAIFAVFTVFSLIVRQVMDLRLRREAEGEYRYRSHVAPTHVVQQATGEVEGLAAAFRPEVRFCVCLASDWRSYQGLSGRLPSSQLAMIVGEYYSLCRRLLAKHLPLGNYFVDWVADEFFVVVYPVEGVAKAKLTDLMLAFASDLLREKGEFLRLHGLPRQVDIGLAAGEALIGLMGPEGLGKATALGDVAGHARRRLSNGKYLRRSRGDEDRIVFGRDCMTEIQQEWPVVTVALSGAENGRDLGERELFYLEPTASLPLRREA